ncbi:MAG: hypothetical protein M3N53_14270 [Actinomycetota bacterium]|nr:hypothetical protein [Actinomycetota bacterium]
MRVAVVGKGGSGKSMVAGTMARLLARRGHRVLALDSDPMPGLAINLGLGPLDTPMLIDAVEKNEQGRWQLKKGIGAARAVQRYAVTAPDGVKLLQYGKATEEGLGPILGSINAFNAVASRLGQSNVLRGWTIVGDLPAGPRQTAFGWAPYADAVLVVVEPTWQSILTARRVARIARQRGEVEALFILNKVCDEQDVLTIRERLGESAFAAVPLDDAAREADRRGLALLDVAPQSCAVRAIELLVDRLEERSVERCKRSERRVKRH